MLRTIRWRIGLPYIILIAVLMLGLGLFFSAFLTRTYRNLLETEQVSQARLISTVLAAHLEGGAGADTLDTLAKEWAEQIDKRVTIIASDGTVIGESQGDRLQMENHAGRPEVIQARFSGQGTEIRYSETVSMDMMYTAVPIRSGSEVIGYARIATALDQIQSEQAHLQRVLLGASALSGLAALLLAVLIADRTTNPLRQLAQAASQVAQGRLESHLIPTTQDEIGQLTQKFNEMTVELRAQMQALDAERSRMAAVFEVMTDGVLIVDEQGQVQLVNGAAESMFGLVHSQVLGRTLIEVLRHHQIQDLWVACRNLGETQQTVVEIPARRLYLQCIATPLGQAQQGNTLLLFQNLTRLRRLETVRQDFISNISHELRTPLASLKALTETLQEGALDDPPAAHRFLSRITTEVDALSQMVEELLELTRIESGRVPLKMGTTSPAGLLQAAVDRLSVQAERVNLTIRIDCPDTVPAVLADARRLEQVVVNLLHNAIKFTPPGGRIDLSARPQDEFVRFEIADTGLGIPEEDLERIFERFYKTDRARSSGGTGLGLAIARHLVEAHGGQIWAESVEGQGSRFIFLIPAAG